MTNGPHQKFDLTLDDMVEAEIKQWLEDRDNGGTTVEAEQGELFEEE